MRFTAVTACGALLWWRPANTIGSSANITTAAPSDAATARNGVLSFSSSCGFEIDGSCPLPPSTLQELGARATRNISNDHDGDKNETIGNPEDDYGRLVQQQQQQKDDKEQAAHEHDEDEGMLSPYTVLPGDDMDDAMQDDGHFDEEVLVATGFGVPQQVMGPDADKVRGVLAQMKQYMWTVVYSGTFPFYETRGRCQNTHELCTFWAAIGECEGNADYMHSECAPACQSCEQFLRQDQGIASSSSSPETTGRGIAGLVDIGYGIPQEIGGLQAAATKRIVDEIVRYMKEVVFSDNYPYKDVREECQNRHKLCALWAAEGECESNANFMKVSCAPACQSCEQLLYEHRCRVPDRATMTAQNIWKPGDLNVMFERIVATPEYNSTVLLRPNDTVQSIAESNYTGRSPWVVLLDDFLTPSECTKLIELGSQRGYEISRGNGPKKFDGTYDTVITDWRTSTNTWCQEACMADPIAKQVVDRIEQLTNIPNADSEYLQLLRYEVNQYYHVHHDYIEHEIDRPQGVRILTVFLYLNDVEAGGGTHFPRLNLTVLPKRGRALIWPSVYNEYPDVKDPATEHEALPVLEGVKYGANAWLHQRDFKKTFHQNCF